MHSRIFQISLAPIAKDDFLSPSCLYDSCPFADYIGGETEGDERIDDIKSLQTVFDEIFDIDGETLIYKGMGDFVEKWINRIKKEAVKLDETKYFSHEMWRIREMIKSTHLMTDFKFYIEDWNEYAGDANNMIGFLLSKAKEGDKIYVGSVIDYHF